MQTDSEVLFHALYIVLLRADNVVLWGVTITSFLAGYTLARIVGYVRQCWRADEEMSCYVRRTQQKIIDSIEQDEKQ